MGTPLADGVQYWVARSSTKLLPPPTSRAPAVGRAAMSASAYMRNPLRSARRGSRDGAAVPPVAVGAAVGRPIEDDSASP